MATVSTLLPLFRELNDLKRIRVATSFGSVAERSFRRSWSRLIAGEALEAVASKFCGAPSMPAPMFCRPHSRRNCARNFRKNRLIRSQS